MRGSRCSPVRRGRPVPARCDACGCARAPSASSSAPGSRRDAGTCGCATSIAASWRPGRSRQAVRSRRLIATAAALAAAALGAPAAHAAGVVVRVSDRETRIDEETLRNAADVPAGTYTLRGQGGAGDAIAHPPAVSLPRVLELAGVSPDALSFVSIRRPNGTLTVLEAGDLARPAPFPEGPPLVWLDADSVRFLRPVRDDADVNAADNIATAGEDLVVRVQQGPLLRVALRVAPAGPARPRASTPGGAGHRRAARRRADGALALRRRDGGDRRRRLASLARPGRVRRRGERRWRRRLRRRLGAARREGRRAARASRADRWRRRATASDRPSRARSSRPRMILRRLRPPLRRRRRRRRSPAPEADADADQPRSAPVQPRKRRLRARPRAAPPGAVPVRGVLVAATIPSDAVAPPSAALPDAARQGASPDHAGAAVPTVALACSLLALGAWRERRRRRP